MTLTSMSIFYIQRLLMFTTKESPKILKKDSQNITKTNPDIRQEKDLGNWFTLNIYQPKGMH
jgi:hypothetical protein